MIKEITVDELKKMREENKEHVLIDVRQPHEVEIATIGGELIPLGTVSLFIEKFPADKPVIVYCRSGRRSADAVEYVQELTKQDNIYNLKGGILEWADKIDPSVRKY